MKYTRGRSMIKNSDIWQESFDNKKIDGDKIYDNHVKKNYRCISERHRSPWDLSRSETTKFFLKLDKAEISFMKKHNYNPFYNFYLNDTS
jgi:hypothetical protein